MATLKCKMCGGNLELIPDENICECEFCGTRQTVPTADNEKKITLFDRANRLRMKSEFDKAASVYESIVNEFPEDAEAYWGLCLCKYGIEYVDDPATGKKVPTCHRTSFDGIFKDTNFELAQEYSEGITQSMYREEAKEIDRLQKAILEIAQKEAPFDIFICYKETDENGNRTKDSVRAQEIYNELTKEGYKVFFSRITLEDKLGEAYEPYIFSALNSSKIMLAIGTSYDNYNAVWVKNEWSRFLQMMKEDPSKKLIPCYSDIDAYDMPEEFSNLQGQDMAKIGFLQDLLRGVGKILGGNKEKEAGREDSPQIYSEVNVSNLMRRGFLSLEDKDWGKANELFDNVLNIDAENAEAYLGMMLAKSHFPDKKTFEKEFITCRFDPNRYYNRMKQFASPELIAWIDDLENKREIEHSRIVEEERKRKKEEKKKREQQIKEEELKRKREEEKRIAKENAPERELYRVDAKCCVSLEREGVLLNKQGFLNPQGTGKLVITNKAFRYEAKNKPGCSFTIPVKELICMEYKTHSNLMFPQLFLYFTDNREVRWHVDSKENQLRCGQLLARELEVPFEVK